MTVAAAARTGGLAFAVAAAGAGCGLVARDARAAVVMGCLSVVVVLTRLPAEATVAAVLATFAAPLVWVTPPQLGDPRLIVPMLLLPLAARVVSENLPLRLSAVDIGTATLGVTWLVASAWSPAGQALSSASALLTAATLVLLVRSQLSLERLLVLFRFAGAGIITTGLMLAPLTVGLLAGRLRGVFINPNGLAVAIVLVLPLLWTGRWRVFGVAALPLIVLSGSRSGSAACLTEIAVLLAVTGQRGRLRTVLVGLTVAGALAFGVSALRTGQLSGATAGSGLIVTRFNDSRSAAWQQALAIWHSAPLTGVGASAHEIEAGSSYLKLLMELGLIGVVAVVPLLFSLARAFLRGTPPIAALAAGAAVSAAFEGWLFTAGSLFFVVFWLAVGCSRSEPK